MVKIILKNGKKTEIKEIHLEIHRKEFKTFLIFLRYELDLRHNWIASAGSGWRFFFSSAEDLQFIR